jgi:hypothetical protein
MILVGRAGSIWQSSEHFGFPATYSDRRHLRVGVPNVIGHNPAGPDLCYTAGNPGVSLRLGSSAYR